LASFDQQRGLLRSPATRLAAVRRARTPNGIFYRSFYRPISKFLSGGAAAQVKLSKLATQSAQRSAERNKSAESPARDAPQARHAAWAAPATVTGASQWSALRDLEPGCRCLLCVVMMEAENITALLSPAGVKESAEWHSRRPSPCRECQPDLISNPGSHHVSRPDAPGSPQARHGFLANEQADTNTSGTYIGRL